MNKEKHVGMTFADNNNISKKINDSHFKDLSQISAYLLSKGTCENISIAYKKL